MPTNYDYADVRCPYFVGSKKTKITCEGLTEGSFILQEFFTNEKKLRHREIFCDDKYWNCEICKMLDEKNEDDSVEKKICKICGKEFIPTQKSRKLCSDECRKISKNMTAKKQQEGRKEKNRELLGTRTCTVCGKEFQPRNSKMIRCSSACTAKRGNDYKALNRKARIEETNAKKEAKLNDLVERTVEARESGTSYGKLELKPFLAQQSEDMAKRRREMEAEWERKRKNGNKKG